MDHGRILALDYGEKRIGIAVSDPLGMTAQPLHYIGNTEHFLIDLKAVIEAYSIHLLLIGNPLDTRGGNTPKTTDVKQFADRLKKEISVPIEWCDERYSTVAATKQLDALGINRKKQRRMIDSQAAAFFLQGYLDRA